MKNKILILFLLVQSIVFAQTNTTTSVYDPQSWWTGQTTGEAFDDTYKVSTGYYKDRLPPVNLGGYRITVRWGMNNHAGQCNTGGSSPSAVAELRVNGTVYWRATSPGGYGTSGSSGALNGASVVSGTNGSFSLHCFNQAPTYAQRNLATIQLPSSVNSLNTIESRKYAPASGGSDNVAMGVVSFVARTACGFPSAYGVSKVGGGTVINTGSGAFQASGSGQDTWSISPSAGVNPSSGSGTSTGNVTFQNTGNYTITYSRKNNSNPSGCAPASNARAQSFAFTVEGTPCTQPGAYTVSSSASSSGISLGQSANFSAGSGNPSGSDTWSITPATGVSSTSGTGSNTGNITFNTAGTYTVKFIRTNSNTPAGCTGAATREVTRTIVVNSTTPCTNPSPFGISSTTSGIILAGQTTSFTAGAGAVSGSTAWTITPAPNGATSLSGTGSSTGNITFNNEGNYVIAFVRTNSSSPAGCTPSSTYQATRNLRVNAATPCTEPGTFTVSSSTGSNAISAGGVSSFTAGNGTPSGSDTWSITPATGVSSTSGTGSNTGNITFNNTGTYTVKFTRTNSSIPSNCSPNATREVTRTIVVNNLPCTQPGTFTVSSSTGSNAISSGGVSSFTAGNGTPSGSDTWSITPTTGVSNTSGTGSNTGNITFNTSGTYTVKFIRTNNNTPSNCSPNATREVTRTIVVNGRCVVTSTNPDTDGDGIADICDEDDDNDGILDRLEVTTCNIANKSSITVTSPLNWQIAQTTNTGNVQTLVDGNAFNAIQVTPANTVLTNQVYLQFQMPSPTVLTGIELAADSNKLFDAGAQLAVESSNDGTNWTNLSGTIITTGSNQNGIISPYPESDNLEFVNNSTAYTYYRIVGVNATTKDYLYEVYFRVSCDTDGDGIPNRLDLDSDNDGISDLVESGNAAAIAADTNKDGTVSRTESAPGANGVPLAAEGGTEGGTVPAPSNTDGAGGADPYDLDSDNDGIHDLAEGLPLVGGNLGTLDANNDGVLDSTTDADKDGIRDSVDDATNAFGGLDDVTPDTDGDGQKDFRDLDTDNDGISDIAEGGNGNLDANNDGKVDAVADADGDGIADVLDSNDSAFGDPDGALPNSDNDSGPVIPNYRDLDSDNDGINDVEEAAGGVDANGDGQKDNPTTLISNPGTNPTTVNGSTITGSDPDNDGIVGEADASPNTFGDAEDTDGDGVADTVDLDDDNDGILDTQEGAGDTDGDGIPNRLDLDSDNDGISDLVESGNAAAITADTNKDGTVSKTESAPGANGVPLAAEGGTEGGTVPAPLNTDGAGGADPYDLDSDNDGIHDLAEGLPLVGGNLGTLDANNDGVLDSTTDADKDGIRDSVDDATNAFGGLDDVTPDTDGDGQKDFRDLDTDNDGISDIAEGGNGNLDANNDGKVDAVADADGDGIADVLDSNDSAFGDPDGALPNSDNDSGPVIPDYRDLDSDNDGINDVEEATGGVDANGDGQKDNPTTLISNPGTDPTTVNGSTITGSDPDNDGIVGEADASPNTFGDGKDNDRDGVADAVDLDDDNDGILDKDESPSLPLISSTVNSVVTVTSNGNTNTDGLGATTAVINGIERRLEGGIGLRKQNNQEYNLVFNFPTPIPASKLAFRVISHDKRNSRINISLTGGANPSDFGLVGADSPNGIIYDANTGNINGKVNGSSANADGYLVGNSTDLVSSITITSGTPSQDGYCMLALYILEESDTDGDGISDHKDLDSDNDGISDLVESGNTAAIKADTNDDGTISRTESAPGANGVPLAAEGTEGGTVPVPLNTDGEGGADPYDLDSDNDGIHDLTEGLPIGGNLTTLDANNDGVLDSTADADKDGIRDSVDATTSVFGGLKDITPDVDGDDQKDFRDLDTDNDGISDIAEGGNGNLDGNNDGKVDVVTDTDKDGIADGLDSNDGVFGDPDAALPNSDSDSNPVIPNFRDLDSDNDGINDVEEAAGGVDANGDGQKDNPTTLISNPGTNPTTVNGSTITGSDPDNDGIVGEADASPNTFGDSKDTDGDGVADTVDLDDDNDGILDTQEGAGDTDGDGIPNRLDLDSDNDGISDLVESGNAAAITADTNKDGTVSKTESAPGANGVPLAAEGGTEGGTVPAPLNTDGAGGADPYDLDSDNDGIHDLAEGLPLVGGNLGTLDANNDGVLDSTTDADKDGIRDSVDDATNAFGGLDDVTPDTDGDGQKDFRDLDTDNDGISDIAEGGNGNLDANNDGKVDAVADADGDGIADVLDSNDSAFGDPDGALPNSDNDSGPVIPDYRDLDSDNDGINDVEEATGGVDANGDGQKDNPTTLISNPGTDPTTVNGSTITGSDPDNDGIVGEADASPNTFGDAEDTDRDGVTDAVDLDDDNDGILDKDESPSLPLISSTVNSVVTVTSNGNTNTDGLGATTAVINGIERRLEGGIGLRKQNNQEYNLVFNFPTPIPASKLAFRVISHDKRNSRINISLTGGANPSDFGLVGADSPNGIIYDANTGNINGKVNGSSANADGYLVGNSTDLVSSITITSGTPSQDGYCMLALYILEESDTDGDGISDHKDLDSDNDGISDLVESGNTAAIKADTNDDGTISKTESAPGANGVPLAAEGTEGGTVPVPLNTDGEGGADPYDLDSDNDGIHDLTEGLPIGGNLTTLDANNDGVLDSTADADKDGIRDSVDATTSVFGGLKDITPDVDGDGQKDFRDLDTDNDGISDIAEGGNGNLDGNNDGKVDVVTDTDKDGIADGLDSNDGVFGDPDAALPNSDSDSNPVIPNFRDLDSDNDGINDVEEAAGGVDADGDGQKDNPTTLISNPGTDPTTVNGSVVTGPDPDKDGIVGEADASPNTFGDAEDTDGDGVADTVDLDDDNDGILDTQEGAGDTDGDGIPNRLDLDSDNDGISDLVESGNAAAITADTNKDGTVSKTESAPGANGVPLAAEGGTEGGTVPAPLNTDGAGGADPYDLDSDNDGIHDLAEGLPLVGGNLGTLDANNDGVLDSTTDADKDGIRDSVDDATNAFGGLDDVTPDTDGDGQKDFRDLDTDNDGISDIAEGGNGNLDANNDGKVDAVADADGDGIADVLDSNDSAFGDPDGALPNSDNDSGPVIPDYRDLDSDNDGINDVEEATGGVDANGDGQKDNPTTLISNPGTDPTTVNGSTITGSDPDNDGIVGEADASPNTFGDAEDTDRDGVTDAVDLDDDNDGILDKDESPSLPLISSTVNSVVTVTSNGNTNTDGLGATTAVINGIERRLEGGIGLRKQNNQEYNLVFNFPTPIPASKLAFRVISHDKRNSRINISLTGGANPSDFGLVGADSPNGIIYDANTGNINGRVNGSSANGNGYLVGNSTDLVSSITITSGTPSQDGYCMLALYILEESDTDGDGISDHKDLDSDNDGISDLVESGNTEAIKADTNDDGTISRTESAPGANGVPLAAEGTEGGVVELPLNTDGEGGADPYDLDSDNDGIHDLTEGLPIGGNLTTLDANNDGVLDSTADADKDGIRDSVDATTSVFGGLKDITPDVDGDDQKDFRDLDTDNDGISDIAEGGNGNLDGNNDGKVDVVTDTDKDGIADGLDSNDGVFGDPDAALPNSDSDSNPVIPNFRDLDSDNDGINDVEEAAGGVDADGDGQKDNAATLISNPGTNPTTVNGSVVTGLDPDKDGIVGEADASPNTFGDAEDTDGDGVADTVDLDDDNDGILDTQEGAGDTDGDGIPNRLDLDSDNDGISDLVESGNAAAITADTNKDGTVSKTESAPGANGVPLAAEGGTEGGTVPAPLNTDGAGGADPYDLDSDNDGIHDLAEGLPLVGGNLGTLDANNDGVLDSTTDADKDGIRDSVDDATNAFGGLDDVTPDTDGDGQKDFRDLDTDNDGISDIAEGGNGNLDANNDGKVDAVADADGDGIADVLDSNDSAFGDPDGALPNSDNDSGPVIPDYRDLDSDNDGINDVEEATGGVDANGDGQKDNPTTLISNPGTDPTTVNGSTITGSDPDNDGIVGEADASPNTFGDAEDTDRDGVTDAVDLDDDNDGILDKDESPSLPLISSTVNSVVTVTSNGNTNTDGLGATTAVINGIERRLEGGIGLRKQNNQEYNLVFNFPTPIPASKLAFRVISHDKRNSRINISLTGGANPSDFGLVGADSPNGIIYDANTGNINGKVNGSSANADGYLVGNSTDLVSSITITSGTPSQDGYCMLALYILEESDTDGDGISDHKDLDSDNDGISDLVESGNTAAIKADTNDDGTISKTESAPGANGVPLAAEGTEGGTVPVPLNTDGEGGADPYDLDSDNDGIHDLTEGLPIGGNLTTLDANNDGVLDSTADADKDGIRDSVDATTSVFGGLKDITPDVDGDGQKDFRDLDTDNDGISDIAEGGNGNLDGNNDGKVDVVTDTDKDGIADGLDSNDGVFGDPDAALPNSDSDSNPVIPNFRDLDSDNDGINDVEEAAGGVDADGDGQKDNPTTLISNPGTDPTTVNGSVVTGPDPDKDGIVGEADATPNTFGDGKDTDGDRVLDAVDLDDDNDGILDKDESPSLPLISSTVNSVVTVTSNGNTNTDGLGATTAVINGIERRLEGGIGLRKQNNQEYNLVFNFPTPIPASKLAFRVVSHDKRDSRINISLTGGANRSNFGLVGADSPNGIIYDANTGNINGKVNGSSASSSGYLVGNSTDLVSSITITSGTPSQDGYCMLALYILEESDTDGDGISDHKDLDSDNDGISDLVESGNTAAIAADTNDDGTISRTESAPGANGVPLAAEGGTEGGTVPVPLNTDGEGGADPYDLDSDNDGIHDLTEGLPIGGNLTTLDANNDGVLDSTADADKDGIRDSVDATTSVFGGLKDITPDVDGDGQKDFRDLDTDNDGISDIAEGGNGNLDGNNDGKVDVVTDTDKDGIADGLDSNDGVFGDPDAALPNSDSDSNPVIPNFRDLDSDNDGINDVEEAAGGVDADGDGQKDNAATLISNPGTNPTTVNGSVVTGPDPDKDGIVGEADATPNTFGDGKDTDGDGVLDAVDLDDDNDGILDKDESPSLPLISSTVNSVVTVTSNGNTNTDGLGATTAVINGIERRLEGGIGLRKQNNQEYNLVFNFPTPIPASKLAFRVISHDKRNSRINISLTGGANPSDFGLVGADSPNGIIYDANTGNINGRVNGSSANGNGYLVGNSTDLVSSITITSGTPSQDGYCMLALYILEESDTDGDGISDHKDLDSDNDGISDLVESGNTAAIKADTNDDGTISKTESAPGANGVPLAAEGTEGGTVPVPLNTDGEGGADAYDLDSDNDGIHDLTEGLPIGGDLTTLDANNDGVLDSTADADKDGIRDSVDATTSAFGGLKDITPDVDGDDQKDFRDLDTDNDGISDIAEGGNGNLDGNNDGKVDVVTDTDKDGIADGLDSNDGVFGDPDAALPNSDSDSNPVIPNFRDLDSDNDGINDVEEAAGGVDADGDGQKDNPTTLISNPGTDPTTVNGSVVTGPDPDKDGIVGEADATPNTFGDGKDTDGDGVLDAVDLDDDNDGILDKDESPSLPLISSTVNSVVTVTSNGNTNTDGLGATTAVINGIERRLEGGIGLRKQNNQEYNLVFNFPTPIPASKLAFRVISHDKRNSRINISLTGGANRSNFGLVGADSPNGIIYDANTGNINGKVNGSSASSSGYLVGNSTDLVSSITITSGTPSQDGYCMLALYILEESDTDGDGISDHKDLDSDNDGISDLVESGNTAAIAADTNDDGTISRTESAPGANGVPLAAEGGTEGGTVPVPLNTDGEGGADPYDLDSDNDGIHDLTEGLPIGGNLTTLDANNDGVLDSTADADKDGIRDSVDATTSVFGGLKDITPDVDGDGQKDFRDLDTDNDGISDIAEGGNGNLDGNNDGKVDVVTDTDKDGIADGLDSNDGVFGDPDAALPNSDSDSNPVIPNFRDLDSDNDGINDVEEAAGGVDADGDGQKDNPTTLISNPGTDPTTVNGSVVTGPDPDKDGIVGEADATPNTFGDGKDTDGDRVLDAVDLDDDNDGILDKDESPSLPLISSTVNSVVTVTSNGNTNTDGLGATTAVINGIERRLEGGIGLRKQNNQEYNLVFNFPTPIPASKLAFRVVSHDKRDSRINISLTGGANRSNFGLVGADSPNGIIYDANTGNINGKVNGSSASSSGYLVGNSTDLVSSITITSGTPSQDGYCMLALYILEESDTDGDGISDHKDLDSDNDGISDLVESGNTAAIKADTNDDGTISRTESAPGANGVPLAAEGTEGGTVPVPLNTDGEGGADPYDLDSDNDGIHDLTEGLPIGGNLTTLDANNDGVLDSTADADKDGIRDSVDATTSAFGGLKDITPDVDGDDQKDFRDLDTDNDGISDIAEGGNGNLDGNNDGKVDVVTDTDKDGIADGLDSNDGVFGDPDAALPNSDSDSNPVIPNFRDLDSDNDGINDVEEAAGGVDADGDGQKDNPTTLISNPGTDPTTVNGSVVTGPDPDNDGIVGEADLSPNTFGDSRIITANTLWLRADENVTGGADVTSWKSRTNASVDFQGFGTPNNTVTSNNLNFNPVITFVPGDGDYLSYTGNLNPRTVYMVYNSPSVSPWTTPFTNDDGNGIGHGESNDSGIFNTTYTPVEVRNGLGHVNGSVTSLTSYDRPDNYALISNRYTANISNASHTYTVARDRTSMNRLMDGNIAEIMVFSDAHSSIKRKQIESYLAIKYGFTLSNNTDGDASVNEDIGGSIKEGDYILADNTKVWDSESAYHHDVAGIGRYDQMGLYQKQSKSVNSDAIITIGLNAIAATNALNANTINADEDFLMWGNNNGVINTVSTSELVCAPEVTLGRTWKIVEKGVVGSVELAATKSVIDGALNTANTIKVLKIADDANFTNNVTYIPLTDKTVNGENVYSVTYDFNGTKYFTYTEVNGIFWSGTSSTWIGGNGSNNQASLNAADTDKVMIVDAFGTNNHATLSENAKVECVWIKENSKLMVSNDKYLEFDEKFILDGEIRLIGKAQLLQTHSGTTNVEGNGKLYIDQQSNIKGTNGIYRYNYWSSPVVGTLNATSYKVGEIMKDGTTPTSENSQVQDINFVSSYDGNASSTPITVSEHWIWSYLNGTTRSNWSQKKSTGDLLRGQGFIMKGTGATNGQNYTFVGTPNSGNISFPISANASSLLGNPYPSTLDSDAFIEDNPSTTGSLYFWEHTGEVNTTGATDGHNKFRYEGGYAVRTKGVGVAANSISTNTGTGTGTYHEPSQYMAVGQGFFVTGNGTGGTITFNNAQRKYNGSTYFFRKKGKVASTNKGQASLPVIKLGFDYYNKSNVKLHRQIAISFKKGNTFGFDYGYDSAMFDVQPTDMYWELEKEDKMIIAGVQEISDALEVPVVIAIDSDKPTHLMLDSHIHINRSVFIEDKVAKKTYDLSSGAVELDLAKGVYKNRFYLKFKKGSVLDVDKEILDGELTVFVDQNKKELVISNANNLMVEKVDIYTILGQNFQNWKLHKNLKEIRLDVGSFSSAVYVLKIKTNKGVLSKKVIIQK